MTSSSGKRNVFVWRPSVCMSQLFLSLIRHMARILNVTHQRAARDAASVHFRGVLQGRTYLFNRCRHFHH